MSKIFDGIITRFSHFVGNWGNALFYNLLHREMFKEIYALSGNDETRALTKFREIMASGALESAERHPQIFWFFPDTPEKALRYLNVLWQIFLGVEIGEFEKIQDTEPGTGRERYVFRIKHCPFCGGYGKDAEDTVRFSPKIPRGEGFACGLVSMIQQVANGYIMSNTGVKVKVTETGCVLRGAPQLEVTVVVFQEADWQEGTPQVGEHRSKLTLDITAIEDAVNKPLDKFKEQFSQIIEKEAHMTPQEMFGLFDNYEADLVRIIGFLPVHFLNEYGNLLEKLTRNPTFGKLIGHVYNSVKKSAPLFVPPEVARDFLNVFLAFIEDLAPAKMIERYKMWESFDYFNLMWEGVGMALRDLGVDFTGLKANFWEELQLQQKPPEQGKKGAGEVKEGEPAKVLQSPEMINLVGEVAQLIFDLMAFPSKLLVASSHAQAKSIVTARGELMDAIKNRLENIFDIVGQLRPE